MAKKLYRDIMEYGENLDWCRPYVDESGQYYLVMTDGRVNGMHGPGIKDCADCETGEEEDENLKKLAQAVNKYYSDYSGYDDDYIARQAMTETGCTSCPYFGICDAMSEESGVDEDEEDDE